MPLVYGKTSVRRRYSGELSKTGYCPPPPSLTLLIIVTSAGEFFRLWPVLRARYSLISHVACPSITARRAVDPSSLLRPRRM
jgi:hypothetical protein